MEKDLFFLPGFVYTYLKSSRRVWRNFRGMEPDSSTMPFAYSASLSNCQAKQEQERSILYCSLFFPRVANLEENFPVFSLHTSPPSSPLEPILLHSLSSVTFQLQSLLTHAAPIPSLKCSSRGKRNPLFSSTNSLTFCNFLEFVAFAVVVGTSRDFHGGRGGGRKARVSHIIISFNKLYIHSQLRCENKSPKKHRLFSPSHMYSPTPPLSFSPLANFLIITSFTGADKNPDDLNIQLFISAELKSLPGYFSIFLPPPPLTHPLPSTFNHPEPYI